MGTEPSPVINMPTPDIKSPEFSKPKKSLWAIVILMVLAIAVSSWYWQKQKIGKPVIYNQLPAGYKTQAPEAGKLPEGFPQELILSVGKFEVIRTEDTKVASGQNQKIVEVKTTDKPESLAGLYRNTLTDPKQGWQLISSKTTNNIIVLAFKKDTATLTVTIMPKASGSQMNLTYVLAK